MYPAFVCVRCKGGGWKGAGCTVQEGARTWVQDQSSRQHLAAHLHAIHHKVVQGVVERGAPLTLLSQQLQLTAQPHTRRPPHTVHLTKSSPSERLRHAISRAHAHTHLIQPQQNTLLLARCVVAVQYRGHLVLLWWMKGGVQAQYQEMCGAAGNTASSHCPHHHPNKRLAP